jgi:DNA polymerase III sliding clamp (beta) subunit (PCNA family)
MDVTCNTKALLAALDLARQVGSKSALPILECVVLTVTEGALRAESADLVLWTTSRIDATTRKPGATAVPHAWLRSVLPNCGAETALTLDGETLHLRSGRRHFKHAALDPALFPARPPEPREWHALPEGAAAVLERAVRFASTSDSREHLMSVQLRGGYANATNGHILTRLALQAELPETLLPSRLVHAIPRLVGPLHVGLTENHIAVQAGEARVTMPRFNASIAYPTVEEVIPPLGSGRNSVSVERVALAKAVVAVSSGLGSVPVVGISLDGAEMIVEGKDDDGGEGRDVIAAEQSKGGVRISFEPAYLLLLLNAQTGERVTLEWDGELDPMRVDAGDDTTLAMPKRWR